MRRITNSDKQLNQVDFRKYNISSPFIRSFKIRFEINTEKSLRIINNMCMPKSFFGIAT